MTTIRLDEIADRVSSPHVTEHERKASCHAYLIEANAVLSNLLKTRSAQKVAPLVEKIGTHIDQHFFGFTRNPQEKFGASDQSNVRAEVTAFGVNAMMILTDFVNKLMPDAEGSALKNHFTRAGLHASALTASTKIDSALSTFVAVAANEKESLSFRKAAFSHLDTLRLAADHMGHTVNEKELIKPFAGIHNIDHRVIRNELVIRNWDHC